MSGIYGNDPEDREMERRLNDYLSQHEVCNECEEYADDCECEDRGEWEPDDDSLGR
jgi:hypothetical protein